ncbi:MAG TPA: DUF4192 domain-containing protein [Candidatus Avipropionibacterium avicola]|uniref:DUF4192 domain-containing protein n=1 Tax=Candidatus Avipropionibacterium avicola TaxID=2840701 RepID=A0A9D1GZZ4_9ACTN|nr:DUF4192 domain-containing protein [Candidatus Avipropionibacterium avicola]
MTTDTHTRIRAASPEDMLALVPYLLGFRPEESLVTVLLSGSRIVLTARVDLPTRRQACPALDQLVGQLDEVGQRHQVDRVVVAVFSADLTRSSEVLRRLALDSPLPVVLALHCDRDRYRILAEDGVVSDEYPFDPTGSVAVAEAVLAGLGPLADRAAVADRVAPGEPAVVEELRQAAEEVDLPDDPGARAALMRSSVERGLQGGLDPVDRARLALLCLDLEVRDEAWLMMDRAEAEAHLEVWLSVARSVPMVLSAGPVSLAGMAAWLTGDGAMAWCCVDRMAEEHPQYRMAGLLQELLAQAVHPDTWAEMVTEMVDGREDA